MIPSPIYWSATGYDLVMRALYGRGYSRLYSDVAALIPDGASVTDVCCGTARLYRDFLKARGCRYVGLDYNPILVRAARRAGKYAAPEPMRESLTFGETSRRAPTSW